MARRATVALAVLALSCSEDASEGAKHDPSVAPSTSSDGSSTAEGTPGSTSAAPSPTAPVPTNQGAAGGASVPDGAAGTSGLPAVAGAGGTSAAPGPVAGEAPFAGAGGTQAGGGSGASGAPSTQGGSGGAANDGDSAGALESSAAIDDLVTHLALDPSERPPLEEQPFASVPLTAADSERAKTLLVDDHAARIRVEREAENAAQSITMGDYTLRYAFTIFGEAPPEGRSLFLSLHGGGEADAATNDGQWENQQVLYQPDEGIYLSPRAPTNTWNMWHQDHIDPLFTRLIENLIVFEGVNPNRVYVMGYSAGGDGVYQLGPRMADYWGAAAMMAGHPNDAQPLSLRNIGFAVHVGALDADFDRNTIGAQWGEMLDALQAEDPEGYEHQVEVHAGKGHWMDLEDAVAVPWMAGFTRNPMPNRVVWLEDDAPHERFYWLRLSEPDRRAGVLVEASYEGQTVVVEGEGVGAELEVMLDDAMLDLDEPVEVVTPDGQELFSGTVERTILDIYRTLEERGDPALVFSGHVRVALPEGPAR